MRDNDGGSIDSILIEKLMRRAWEFWQSRDGTRTLNMQNAFRGNLVVITNQGTYSDGETFAEGIKRLKLGTLVGMRTAGAGVWLDDDNLLADGGIARAAQDVQVGLDGRRLIEGVGVVPDIEVDNLPHATFDGQDAQLDMAIKVLEDSAPRRLRQNRSLRLSAAGPMKRLAALVFAALALGGSAHAVDVWKWKDSKGVVHYGDRPASGVAASTVSVPGGGNSPEELEQAEASLAASRQKLAEPVRPASSYRSRSRAPSVQRPAQSSCAAAWSQYDAAQACFDAHRVAGGKGVTGGGEIVCREVPQPSCVR